MTDSAGSIVGRNLTALRKKKRIGIKTLAEASHLPSARLRDIEASICDSTAKELFAIAGAMGVSPAELLVPSATPPAIVGQQEENRKGLAKQFIENTILAHYRHLVIWQSVTNQSAQIDSGYLGQHLVSLLTGLPGRGPGSRGKGCDLEGGAEVKCCCTLGGMDVPRWDNSLGKTTSVDEYLGFPAIYFVLVDTQQRSVPFPIRVRVWRVCPPQDDLFCAVVRKWESSERKSHNLQLHPPCWKDSNLVTNNCGNLIFPLMYQADQLDLGDVDYIQNTAFNSDPGPCLEPSE